MEPSLELVDVSLTRFINGGLTFKKKTDRQGDPFIFFDNHILIANTPHAGNFFERHD